MTHAQCAAGGRHSSVFYAAIAIACILPFSAPAQVSGWKCVTRPDARITATAIGAIRSDSQVVVLNENHAGVFIKFPSDPWHVLINGATELNPMQMRMVNDLLFPVNALLWAATDSGLYEYWFTSGTPLVWSRVEGAGADTGLSIQASLGSAFILTRHDILRSDDTGRSWRSVRPVDAADLTALAVKDSVCVAGAKAQQLRSPRTVWLSRDLGKTWQDISVNPNDANIPSAEAIALVREKGEQSHRIILASGNTIFFSSAESSILWGSFGDIPQPSAHIRDMTTISTGLSTMHWIVVGSDSGMYLLNTTVDFAVWQRVLPHSTYRFAADTAFTTSLICSATYDGLWEWQLNAAGVLGTPMTRHGASLSGLRSGSQQIRAFDLRGRFLGENQARGAAKLYITRAGKRPYRSTPAAP
jgi:hypothetical protein